MHEDAPLPLLVLKPQSVLQRPQLMRFRAFNLNSPRLYLGWIYCA